MNARKGFTLIEIMIVVAIIAILAAIAIPNFIAYRKTAQMNACIANLKQLESATEAWRIKTGAANDSYPTMSDLVGTGGGGFIKTTLECPSGSSYKAPGGTGTDKTTKWTCTYQDDDTAYKHELPSGS